MSEPEPRSSSPRLKIRDAFILALLALIFIDAMPFSPRLLRDQITPLLFSIELKQGEWNMFGPNPDSENERLSAEIEYADGTVTYWTSPDWRIEPALGRFPESRRLEYLDNISRFTPRPVTVGEFLDLRESGDDTYLITGQLVWDGLAEYAVRNQSGEAPAAKLRQVRLFQEVAEIPNPRDAGWPPMRQAPGFGDEKRLRHERDYP